MHAHITHTRARIRSRTHMHMHMTHTSARAQTRMHPGTRGPDHARTHAPTHEHACMCTHTCKHTRTCMHAHVHALRTCTQAHACMRLHNAHAFIRTLCLGRPYLSLAVWPCLFWAAGWKAVCVSTLMVSRAQPWCCKEIQSCSFPPLPGSTVRFALSPPTLHSHGYAFSGNASG